jgi:hypothetical protein
LKNDSLDRCSVKLRELPEEQKLQIATHVITYFVCMFLLVLFACTSVIDADLEVWEKKGSIPADVFTQPRKRGVHYQIVSHKLYREEQCNFPFR